MKCLTRTDFIYDLIRSRNALYSAWSLIKAEKYKTDDVHVLSFLVFTENNALNEVNLKIFLKINFHLQSTNWQGFRDKDTIEFKLKLSQFKF